MSQTPTRFSNRRRQFLNAFGAAAVTMSPMARAMAAVSSGPIRIGVVLPESDRYPGLPNELLGGFEAFAATPEGSTIKLVPIPAGQASGGAFNAAKGALESGRIDVLSGLVNRNLAARMSPALEASATPFVVCDVGADVLRSRHENAYIIRNSLAYWQANYAAGTWAAANLGKRALIATDFLESGYDMVYAFRHAFEAAGGVVVGVEVTDTPDGSGALANVSDAVRSQRPDFVYGFYSGERANTFLRFYETEQLSRIAPLAGAALLTHSMNGSALEAGFAGITTVSSWASDRATPENDALQSAYRKVRGSDAGMFAMLGYETAQRIAAAHASRSGASLAEALARVSFAGPRGNINGGRVLSESAAPLFVHRLARSGNRLVNVTQGQLAALEIPAEAATHLQGMVKTGWVQAYLAA